MSNCIISGGLMGNASPENMYGKVNIFGMHPENCALTVNPAVPRGGTLAFKDEPIDFRAKSIVIEEGGSLIAGTGVNPTDTNGLGPDKTHSHVLTSTLYGTDQGNHDGVGVLPAGDGVAYLHACKLDCGGDTVHVHRAVHRELLLLGFVGSLFD